MNEQERRERNRERMREYHQKNKEAIGARRRAYYAEHREEILAQQREKRNADKLARGETIRVKLTPEELYRRKLERNRRWREKRRAAAVVKPRERKPKPVKAQKPERLPVEPKPTKDEAHYRLIQAIITARKKHKDDPRCPICGARQCNRALVRVCAMCGSRINIEENSKHGQVYKLAIELAKKQLEE